MGRARRWVGPVLLGLGMVVVLSACEPDGITVTVNDAGDGSDANPGDGICEVTPGGGDCTLRAAIEETNALGDHERIIIAPGIDPVLSSATPLTITDRVTIDGGGATVDALGATGALHISSPDGTTRPWVNLRELVVTGGNADQGGALRVDGPATVTVSRSTLHGNVAAAAGGAIWAGPNTNVSLTNSTVSTNTAQAGGAVWSAGQLSLTHTTVAATTTTTGGAIDHQPDATGPARAYASIVADQAAGCAAPLESLGHNVEAAATCGFTASGDHQHTSAHLGPLADNGGLTPTHHMTLFSGLFDTIGGECDAVIQVDQRGYPRKQGAGCDPGAVERLDVPEASGEMLGFGNGRNHLGTFTLLPAGPAREDLMLSVSGYCARREHGDRITPFAAANHWPSLGFTDCAGPAGQTAINPEWDPSGYFYAITLDDRAGGTGPWGEPVAIEIYDAPHCQGVSGGVTWDGGADTASQRHYRFRVRGNDGVDPRTATVLHDQVITPADCVTMKNAWYPLFTLTNPTQGTYWLQITPIEPTNKTQAEGQNNFALRARNTSVGTANSQWPCSADPSQAVPDAPTLLDADGANRCPEIRTESHLGTYILLSGSALEFALLPVDPEHAGRVLDIELFDIGEGAEGIEILDPAGAPLQFTWEIACYDATYLSESPLEGCTTGEVEPAPPGRGPFVGTFLDSSGGSSLWRPWGPGNSQNQRLNDRLVRLRLQLPTLAENPTWYDGNSYFAVRYYTGVSSGDRTTWTVRIHDGVPGPPAS